MTSVQDHPDIEPEESQVQTPPDDDTDEVAAAPQKPDAAKVGRKPAGTKEIVPFEWKLIGESHGLALTLFKAVAREDVESLLESSGLTMDEAAGMVVSIKVRATKPE